MTNETMSAYRTREFDTQHGGNFIIIGSVLLFEDGAKRTNSTMPQLVEPDVDPYVRAKDIRVYHDEVLRRAEKQFHELRGQLLHRTEIAQKNANDPRHSCLPPSEQEIEELKQLQAKVRQLQQKAEAARKAVEDLTPKSVHQQHAAAQTILRETSRVAEALDRIKI